jgi:HEAT repeat protein
MTLRGCAGLATVVAAGLTAVLVAGFAAGAAWAQDVASAKRAEASPERIAEALRQGNRPDALDYYRALVNKTNQLHLPSLRRICESVIREGLGNASPEVRLQASRALKHDVDADTVPLVLEVVKERKVPEDFLIEEPFLPVRTEGLLPAAVKALSDEDHMVRIWAVHALAKIGGPEAAEPLTKALDDPFPWVRVQAVLGLGQLEARLVPRQQLRALIDDPSPPVALGAAAVLYAVGEQDMKARLQEMLSGPDPHLVQQFALTAELLKSPALNEFLPGLLTHKDPMVRAEAVQAVGQLKVPGTAPALMALLSDSDLGVRAAAAQALGELGEAQAVGELERLAVTGAGQLKVAAVAALGKFGSTAVLAPLRRALSDTDPTVRLAAAQALGSIPGEEVITVLQAVYTNKDEVVVVRALAAASAARLGDSRAVVQLNTDAQSQDNYVKVWAAWGLGEVGTRAQLFTLVNLLVDPDEMVRPVSAGAVLKLSNRLEKEETARAPGSS